MAIVEKQVQWTGADSVSVAATGNQTSDVVTTDKAAEAYRIQVKADNAGTPAAGDTVDFTIQYSLGDPDGAGADEFDTPNHATAIGTLDTNSEDPAIATFAIASAIKSFRIRADNNAAANAITVSATVAVFL